LHTQSQFCVLPTEFFEETRQWLTLGFDIDGSGRQTPLTQQNVLQAQHQLFAFMRLNRLEMRQLQSEALHNRCHLLDILLDLFNIGRVLFGLLFMQKQMPQIFQQFVPQGLSRFQRIEGFACFDRKAINLLLIFKNTLVNTLDLTEDACHFGFNSFGFFGSRFCCQDFVHGNTSTPIISRFAVSAHRSAENQR